MDMNIKRQIRDCVILGTLFSIVGSIKFNLDPEKLILVYTFVIIGMIAGNVLGYLITKMFSKKEN
jgi:hypothetical protein